MRIREAED
jgi:hypothetical protein